MLGTMFTPNRDRAKLIGFGCPLLERLDLRQRLCRGLRELAPGDLVVGRCDRPGACALRAGRGHAGAARNPPADGKRATRPTPTRQLEPPGFMALNYGRRTPITVILAHLVYGGILGAFYRLK